MIELLLYFDLVNKLNDMRCKYINEMNKKLIGKEKILLLIHQIYIYIYIYTTLKTSIEFI